MPAELKLSVVICAYNSRLDYLHRVLDALRRQTLPQSDWELLFVDNCSDPPLAERVDLGWHMNARHLVEPEAGLAFARLRGIEAMRSGVLVYVDDDNVLNPDYLEVCWKIALDWPALGTWGGRIVPDFETVPPPNLQPYLSMLALREVSISRWSNVLPSIDATPWGAGICIRKSVADEHARRFRTDLVKITDRKGTSLSSGGDLEFTFVACGMGLGSGVFPELQVTHLIPATRLSEDYLVRLREGIETSDALLYFKWMGRKPRPWFAGLNAVRALKDILASRGLKRKMNLATLRGSHAGWRALRRAKLI